MDSTANQASRTDREHQILIYLLIAYLVSWAIEIPLALKATRVISLDIPFSIHYAAAFGPFFAGVIVTWCQNGSTGLKQLLQGIMKWRVGPAWSLIAVSPLLLMLGVTVVDRLGRGIWLDFQMLGHVDFLPDLGIGSLVLWLFTFGLGEELGWRGFLLPRLQRDRSAWSATLVLWVIWAIWHVPSFFYLHTVTGVGTLIGFLLGVLAGAIFLTWLYNSTGGSILIVAVWHGLFDYVTACTECKSSLIAPVLSTLVMVWAIVVLVLFKGANLSNKPKQTV